MPPLFRKIRWRLAEIEIEPEYLDDCLAILKEEYKASIELEPSVISIYPMHQNEHQSKIRLLEIYEGRKSYKAHLRKTINRTT